MPTFVTADDPLNIDSHDPAWKAFEKDVANLTARMGSANSSVQYDARLPGVNSKGLRQIDVYVTGELNGIPIAIAIECKKYARPVDVVEMDAFVGKLRDLSVDKGVFYVHDGATDGARNVAAAALHPKIVLKEFAGAELLQPSWDVDLRDFFDQDCPTEHCLGFVRWDEYPQPAGGADVEAGRCAYCGIFAIRCRDCEDVDSDESHCYSCGAIYETDYDRDGLDVVAVVQLSAGAR